jgi:hypothetical protein
MGLGGVTSAVSGDEVFGDGKTGVKVFNERGTAYAILYEAATIAEAFSWQSRSSS